MADSQYGLEQDWYNIIPPPERTAYFHSMHVRLETTRTQKLGIGFGLELRKWGWQRANCRLVLIVADKLIGPDVLFKAIR